MTEPEDADFFCGAGGASLGMHRAGRRVVGYDKWRPAIDTHNANGLTAHEHDLSDPAYDDLIVTRHRGVRLVWASPPCQPFSAAGDGEGEFDDRDGFPWLLRLVAKLMPEVLITENVKGLTFDKHHGYFAGVLDAIRTLGYDVDWKVLNAADYGVPQTRERTIIVARRDSRPITWPMPTHTEEDGLFTARWVSMEEALPDLRRRLEELGVEDPALVALRGAGMAERGGERPPRALDEPSFTVREGGRANPGGGVIIDTRQNDGKHKLPVLIDATGRPSPTIAVASGSQWLLRPGGGGYVSANRRLRPLEEPAPTIALGNDAVNWEWISDRPATTIAGDLRVFQPGGHHEPGQQSQNAIKLTPLELATLQDFPEDWTWCGSKTSIARQIGNAVPSRLAEAVVRANSPAPRP